MAKEKESINKELLKSMDEAVKNIFDKADARIKMPNRDVKDPDYSRTFYKTAKMIYETVTERSCPESVKVL